MTLWKELYDSFDQERTRWQRKSAGRRTLVVEIRGNLDFLGAALKSGLPQEKIMAGLERSVFDQALADGVDFNTIRKARVTAASVDGFDEFKTYVGKDTDELIKRAYARMKTLGKVIGGRPDKDHALKIKALFRFLVLLVMHIEGRKLVRRSGKGA